MNPALRANDVSVILGSNPILHDISFAAHHGEVISLVGPNGAGKSTLFAVLSGDLRPTKGESLLNERRFSDYSAKELARCRAVLPQDHLVRFSYSVEEIVELARLSHNTNPDTDAEIISSAIVNTELVSCALNSFAKR